MIVSGKSLAAIAAGGLVAAAVAGASAAGASDHVALTVPDVNPKTPAAGGWPSSLLLGALGRCGGCGSSRRTGHWG